MKTITIEGLTSTEIRELIKQGKKVGGIDAYVVLPVEKLDDMLSGNEGFILAPNFEKSLKSYSQYRLTLNKKTAAVYLGWKSVNSQSERNVREIEAYIKKYGLNNIVFADEMDFSLYEVMPEQLDKMTKAELKSWYEKNELSIKRINWNKTLEYNLGLIKDFLAE